MSDLPPPAAALIREAREMAIPKRSIPEVAHRVGIDPGTLGNIERGYRNIGAGKRREVIADAPTLAKLARELGITPEQLAVRGERPDAAEILRGEEPRANAPVALRPDIMHAGDDLDAEFIAELLAKILAKLSPADQAVIRYISRMTDGEGKPWSRERKLLEIDKYLESVDSAGSAEGSGRSRPAAGLRSSIRARAFARMRKNSCTVTAGHRDLIHLLG